GGRAAPRGTGMPDAARCEPTAPGSPYEGAGRIAVAADGPVVAERHVVQSQAGRPTRGIVGSSENPAAKGCADPLKAGAAPPVAAAPTDFVVLERTVRDRRVTVIEQATAVGAAGRADAAGSYVVGTPDGLVAP